MPMNTDKPDAVELLPCPYCGGTANLHNDESEFWYVSCRECITQTTHFYNGRDIVIERWNTRDTAENDRLKQEVEAAKEQLREFAEDVAYQYAYERAGCLTTGGLSTMETAFDILGWDDPHKLEGDSK